MAALAVMSQNPLKRRYTPRSVKVSIIIDLHTEFLRTNRGRTVVEACHSLSEKVEVNAKKPY